MKKLVFVALFLAVIVAGCSRQTALVPPEIHYGFDTCTGCGMIISDPHYAAALIWRSTSDDSGQTAVFDDVACLLDWRQQHPNALIAAVWVKNVRTTSWLNASSALFVKSSQLHTPMGGGIAAGTGTNDFSALPIQAPVLTWMQLLETNNTTPGEAGHGD
jgi:copper chaperone NosL